LLLFDQAKLFQSGAHFIDCGLDLRTPDIRACNRCAVQSNRFQITPIYSIVHGVQQGDFDFFSYRWWCIGMNCKAAYRRKAYGNAFETMDCGRRSLWDFRFDSLFSGIFGAITGATLLDEDCQMRRVLWCVILPDDLFLFHMGPRDWLYGKTWTAHLASDPDL
jgi:hypothetical protein|tara:strand:+ start:344 stop:832 length:489 start_codon:yes stop_codon:yes gene_type:complete